MREQELSVYLSAVRVAVSGFKNTSATICTAAAIAAAAAAAAALVSGVLFTRTLQPAQQPRCRTTVDRLNNTNALMAGLWPSLSEAVSQQLVQAMAPGLMQQAAKDYGAGYLTDLKLVQFELGEVGGWRCVTRVVPPDVPLSYVT